jgi:hypothetical protein
MAIRGLITGTLGYDLKKDFLGNSLMVREIETFNYDIYSVDFQTTDANVIQNQIKNEFSNVYSGDINVKVFATQHSYQFPSDALRAAKYNVNVEVVKALTTGALQAYFPELSGAYYSGIDSTFWSSYGKYLLDFKEDFSFNTNNNGNREFNHNLSFGLRTGWAGDNSTTGRKAYAQILASGIFAADKNTTFGLVTMVGDVANVADSSVFRNYYNESYDLLKNSYSFSRRREELPFSSTLAIYNINHSLAMNENGIVDVTEKGLIQGKISFTNAKTEMEQFYTGAFNRCSGFYKQFYNSSIIGQDSGYAGTSFSLPLINTPSKVVRGYDTNSLTANYDVSFTNNPQFSGDGTVTSQTIEFNIDQLNRVDATHSYDYIVNKNINNSGYFPTLFSKTTGNSPSAMSGYYADVYPVVKSIYPNLSLVKVSANAPNIKTKAAVKLSYSNNPTYFVTTNGKTFKILDVTVDKKMPNDIVSEYKIVNRTTRDNKAVLSYGYQSEKGEVQIKISASIGKNNNQFYTDGVGSFSLVGGDNLYKLSEYLEAIYKFSGQTFLAQFNYPTEAFNWFISDSSYSLDSEGMISVTLNYTYTLKKRNPTDYR